MELLNGNLGRNYDFDGDTTHYIYIFKKNQKKLARNDIFSISQKENVKQNGKERRVEKEARNSPQLLVIM